MRLCKVEIRQLFRIVCFASLIVCGLITFTFTRYRRSLSHPHEGPTNMTLEDGQTHLFEPVFLDGVFTFSNVCLELLPAPFVDNVHDIEFTVTQRIAIYDDFDLRIGNHRLHIAGPSNHPFNYYDVHFANSPQRPEWLSTANNVAYFVSSRCPGNLHHFIEEEFVPLYSIVRRTNMLCHGADNQIIYPTPKTDYNTFCRNYSKYNEIVRTLHTNDLQDVYYNVPNNTCFRRAVFGSMNLLNESRDVVKHLIHSYNLSRACSRHNARYVTIISRNTRRIINIDDLVRWIKKSGFKKRYVRIVEFHKLSIRQQMIAACTSIVIIGINGAGLQWSMLMPEGSHVVEMSWPSKSMPFFFQSFLPAYRINYHQVELNEIRFNFTSYELRIRNGRKLEHREREAMRKSPPEDLWKWSDAFLHMHELVRTLSNISNSILN